MGYQTIWRSKAKQRVLTMACSVRKRENAWFEKGSEMGSSRFSTKKSKVEYTTNGEPVHVEVRSTLKGHRLVLCLKTISPRFKEYKMCSSFFSKLKLLWLPILMRNVMCFDKTAPLASLTIFRRPAGNFNLE